MGNKLAKEQQKEKEKDSTKQIAKKPADTSTKSSLVKNASGKLDSQSQPSSPPPSPSTTTSVINNTKITPGTQSDYSHFNSKSTIQDFDLLKVLGKGSFGKVMLVKKKR